jgi:hypothetical protein
MIHRTAVTWGVLPPGGNGIFCIEILLFLPNFQGQNFKLQMVKIVIGSNGREKKW